ncbi:MAG: hypothetical protein F4169_20895 [Gammaproteobacteria bacterium]|nr:hypothetical protein [Gammaproteobacteria bacterium]
MARSWRRIASYLQGLTITQGPLAGQPFELLPWQRRFLAGAFGSSDIGDAALSMARGNAKTTFLAGVACATLDGPLLQPNAETTCVASSFEQARILFDHVRRFMQPVIDEDRGRWRIWDTAQLARIQDRDTGAMVRCIASDPRRAHGLAPALVLADEPAQWSPARAEAMLAALRTSMGKIEGSRLVALGTMPESDDHWFSKMFANDAVDFSMRYQARESDPPFQRRTWKRANPSLDHFPELEAAIRREARRAKLDISLLPSFRSLRLNLGEPDTLKALLLEAGTWERIEAVGPVEFDGPYALGIDLGSGAAMSAAAAYFPHTGALECVAAFPELPSLSERGVRDNVGGLYRDMHQRGELIIAGSRVADIGLLLLEALDRWGAPGAIVCDRWREAELRETLERVGFPLTGLVVRGQGFKDGGEDVREFTAACTDHKVRPRRSLLLRSAMAGARVAVDPAGNRKLAKGSEGGRRLYLRDDAAAASIMAVAEGQRRWKLEINRGRSSRRSHLV